MDYYPGNSDGAGSNHSPPWDDGAKKRKTNGDGGNHSPPWDDGTKERETDGAGGNHSPPWNDGSKKRKTSGVGNSAAGRRATAAAEEAERHSQVDGNYLAPPPPATELVIASNPFDDRHGPHYSRAPPPHLLQQLLPASPRAPPPEYAYGCAPQPAPRLEQPARARSPQGRASRAKPKARGQPPPYPCDPGPVINTKSRMLMGGGNVNVQHPPQQPGFDGLSMPPLPPRVYEARPGPNLAPPQPGPSGAMMPPGPAPCKPTRKRRVCLTPPPVQPYCPRVVWGPDGLPRYQPPMSQLDPCFMGSLPYNPARCLAAPLLHGQFTLPAESSQAPAEPPPSSPRLLDDCAVCGEFVYSSEEPIWCRAGCGLVYHRRCTNLHETAYYLMTNTPNAAWLCQICEENQPDVELIKSG